MKTANALPSVRVFGVTVSDIRMLLILFFLFPASLYTADAAASVRDISAKRECAICHIMWLNEFQQEDVTTLIPYDPKPVVDTGKQDVVSTERICFSCHDGFILDSRFTWVRKKYFHPVGVEPTGEVKIPTREGKRLFPLNNEGKIYCGTCHSAHGVDWKQKESPVFLRAKNVESSLCLACHLERSTGPKDGNHPVFQAIEKISPKLIDSGAKFGVKEGRATVICQSCHRIHGARDEKALMVENKNSALCGYCHEDRYAHDRKEAGLMGTHPVNIVSDKVEIADELVEKGSKKGGQGEIICQTCHKPHYAEKEASILVMRNTRSTLCKTCHGDKKTVDNTKHDLALAEGELKNIRGQTVEEAGTCSACHVPHGGNSLKMWARPLKQGQDKLAELCLSCHADGKVAAKKQVGTYTHPVGKDIARLGNEVELPGYTKEGVQAEGKGRVTCASCHNPHQWDPNDPSKESRPGDPSDASNRFLRVANNGPNSPLCQSCHKDKGSVKGTKHDGATMKRGGRKSLCATCHNVHNGKGPRMWSIIPNKGVDPVSSLCQSCHKSNGLAKDKMVGDHTHPVGVEISRVGIDVAGSQWSTETTSAQDLQALPLFDDKGGRQASSQGNVTCATCHDPHAWAAGAEGAKLDPKAEGDARSSFLRIANSGDAELCTNCHVEQMAVIKSKHNIGKFAPDDKNVLGTAAKDNFVCGNCHVPHNAQGSRLWARAVGRGGDRAEALCRSCHVKGDVAEGKLIEEHSHPLQADTRKLKGRGKPQLPLYNKKGEQKDARRRGRVSCPSCHNPHQWDPQNPDSEAGADMKVEGDGDNSFLRLPAAPNGELCVECHKLKQWVVGTDHDMSITVPDAETADGKKINQSGVCGQCHNVHNAPSDLRLWARAPGEGQDPQETLCRSCHAKGGIAEIKMPVKSVHPEQVQAVVLRGRSHKGGYTPLFDKDGNASDRGVITCPTCHNPHQWDPAQKKNGAGKNLEGSARNSFLRNRSESSLCASCHGLDALFRYKYYHGETSRAKHDLYRAIKK